MVKVGETKSQFGGAGEEEILDSTGTRNSVPHLVAIRCTNALSRLYLKKQNVSEYIFSSLRHFYQNGKQAQIFFHF
jgi:hypothetical protein